ncbi:nuclear transport factor 2 family protein, partial [Sinorhizobium meliloti]|nr:nuclear transport factor 2 family protein [Sinorhizobium meliloti]
MTPLDELLEIERRLWRNDADIYAATYLPEAVLIFPGIGRIDVDTAVEAIRGENAAGRHWAEVSFSAET